VQIVEHGSLPECTPVNSMIVRLQQYHCENNELGEWPVLGYDGWTEAVEVA